MLFFLGKRLPFLGVLIGAALFLWGLVNHSVIPEALGCVVAVVGVVRTIGWLKERQ